MITYRHRPGEVLTLWWEGGTPRIIGRLSEMDRRSLSLLDCRLTELCRQDRLDRSLEPLVLWSLMQCYSYVTGFAQVSLQLLTEIVNWRFLEEVSDGMTEDMAASIDTEGEPAYTQTDVSRSIRRLCQCGLIERIERVTSENEQKGMGRANRYIFALTESIDEAKSQTT
jgi:predicted transcriptional regulator